MGLITAALPLTLGQRRMRTDLVDTKNPDVQLIKESCALQIDVLEHLRIKEVVCSFEGSETEDSIFVNVDKTPEELRRIVDEAQWDIEKAGNLAIKALTYRPVLDPVKEFGMTQEQIDEDFNNLNKSSEETSS